MKRLTLALAATTLLAAPVPATAAVIVYSADLRGGQEVPPVSTTGGGFALATVDTVLNTLRLEVLFGGLLGSTTMAHIHCCAPVGANAGVATPVPSFPGFPLGVRSGSYDRTFDLTLASSFNPAFISANGGTVTGARTALLNGLSGNLAYLNIHTDRNPGGEIRGQFAAPVPEPASWALMLTGFGLAGWSLRRRTRPIPAMA